ncbi:MAG: AraC family transcriptional regulator [Chitinophagaceae bacterium]|nr:AraC family transcriptional regulator [Chitinophagaceae bacterium]
MPFKAYPPRPEQCLAFYPFDTETIEYNSSGALIKDIPVVLYGQFTQVTKRIIGNNFLVFQIIFNPGSLFRLTGMPSYEINNQYLDAALFFSNQIKQINEQFYFAKDYAEMIDVANIFIRTLIKKQKKETQLIDQVCKLLLTNKQNLTLPQIAKEACLSSKQLERKFKERTGVNPKLFERLIRFDNAFRLKNTQSQMDWLRIAMECNYHDYQHLSKEYKDFTSLSPTAFHNIEAKAPERILGLSEGFNN